MQKRTGSPQARAERVTIRLDGTTLEAIERLCQDRNVTLSALVRIAVLDYIGGRSESEAVGITLVRLVEAIETLSATLGQVRSDVRGTSENTRITASMIEATLKVLLFRTVPPPEEDGGAKARAQVDFAEITKLIARQISG